MPRPPLLLPVLIAGLLAAASPARAATFGAPDTLAGWDSGAELLVAAPGAVAWARPGGVWLAAPSAERVFAGAGLLGQLEVAAEPGAPPVTVWTDAAHRVHAHAGSGHHVVEGSMSRVRGLSVAPTVVAWIGVSPDDTRKVQLATRSAGRFGAARTPPQLGRPSHGLVAAGDGRRGLLAWHAQDGDVRRLQTLAVDDGGRFGEARWVTGTDGDATSPALDVAAGGDGVLAWVEGMPLGRIIVAEIAADGSIRARQPLSESGAGAPVVAVAPDGTAVVAWPEAGGAVRAAVRARGQSFTSPATFATKSFNGLAAGVTGNGDAILAWSDAVPGAYPREGARLFAAVAPAGGAFGQPTELARRALSLAAAGDAVTWTEVKPLNQVEIERRVLTARLADARADAPGGPAGPRTGSRDRRAPRVTVRVLPRRGGNVRLRVRSDERATLRATWRSGRRVLGRSRARLRARRAHAIAFAPPRSASRLRIAVTVTDGAGNARKVVRRVRL